MFRPTQPLSRRLQRLALTTKQVNGGYYKGTGTGSTGRHTKYGGYVIDWRKVRTYVAPSGLEEFMLSPFVTSNMKPLRGRFGKKDPKGANSGKKYLEKWKKENGLT